MSADNRLRCPGCQVNRALAVYYDQLDRYGGEVTYANCSCKGHVGSDPCGVDFKINVRTLGFPDDDNIDMIYALVQMREKLLGAIDGGKCKVEVKCDRSNNTDETLARREMHADVKLYLPDINFDITDEWESFRPKGGDPDFSVPSVEPEWVHYPGFGDFPWKGLSVVLLIGLFISILICKYYGLPPF